MVDVTKTPASPDELADTLEAYGITRKPASARAPGSDDIQSTLDAYGIKRKPKAEGPSSPATAPARAPLEVNPRTGRVIEEPERATPKEIAAGEKRGVWPQVVQGFPLVGPAVQMIEAATPGPGKADTFGQRWYDIRQADRAFAQQHPGQAFMANALAGTVGYGALAKLAPWAFGLAGPTTGARIYGGAIGGGILNAADAALRGDDPVSGAIIGGTGGVLGPMTMAGARGTTNALAQYAWPRPGPLGTVPRAGINLLANALEGETPATIAAARSRMGPAGFLGDLNPAMTDIAGAIADIPGPGKAMVRQAYVQRAEQQGDRIEAALTRAMGPRVNLIDQNRFLTEARAAAADPLYAQWRTMQVHPTPEIKALIPRLEAAKVFDQAEEIAGISGKSLNRNFFTGGPQKAYPTTESWDLIKQGLDRRIDQAYTANDKRLAAKLIELKGDLIGEIEKTPAGQIWKQARHEFANRSALIDQMAAGRDTFVGGRHGTSVDEFNDELKHLSRPELMARIIGVRDIASEAMGAAKNGDTSLRNKLLAPNNQKKLRSLMEAIGSPGDADALISALRQEEYLGNQTSNVVGNMQTGASASMRSERKKMFDVPERPWWLESLDLTKPGTWIPPSWQPHNVLQDIRSVRSGRAAPALAPIMLTPEGPQLTEIINALRGEQARVSNVNRLAAPYIDAGGFAITGPGQAGYRRYYEGQRALPSPH